MVTIPRPLVRQATFGAFAISAMTVWTNDGSGTRSTYLTDPSKKPVMRSFSHS
jgi:hypothetical protein